MASITSPDVAHIEKDSINNDIPVSSGSSQVSASKAPGPAVFEPGWRLKVAFASLSIVTLMVIFGDDC
jgi:uncharacterized membrane protein